jgi:hypothetical protein
MKDDIKLQQILSTIDGGSDKEISEFVGAKCMFWYPDGGSELEHTAQLKVFGFLQTNQNLLYYGSLLAKMTSTQQPVNLTDHGQLMVTKVEQLAQ